MEGAKASIAQGSCDLQVARGLCALLSTFYLPATSHSTCPGSQGAPRASRPTGQPAAATLRSRRKGVQVPPHQTPFVSLSELR